MSINRRYAALLFLIILFLTLFFRYSHKAPKRNYCDFRVYHATAQRFLAKEDIYSRPEQAITPFKYSPAFAMLMSPLGFLSRNAASLVFFSLSFLSLIGVFILSKRLIVNETLSVFQTFLLYLIPAIFSARFILQVLDQGQVSIIMLGLVLSSLYLLKQKKDILGGACFGLSVMFKYMPFIFLPYFLLKKKFKFITAALVFIILFSLLPALHVGVAINAQYLKNWMPFITETSLDKGSWYDYKNQSLYSMALRFLTNGSSYKVSVADFSFAHGLILAAIVGLVLYALALAPVKKKEPQDSLDYSMLFLCMAFLNPNAWLTNYIIFIFVCMAIIYYLIKVRYKDLLTIALLAVSFLMAGLASESIVGNEIENLFERFSAITISALLLFLVLARIKFKKST